MNKAWRKWLLGLAVALLASPQSYAAAKKAKDDPAARKGFERVVVDEVFGTPDGIFVVVLRTRSRPYTYLPIQLGELEAIAIRLRLENQVPPRPLTLNLLESVLAAGKIKVEEISIDGWSGDGVFVGRIRLSQNGRSWDLDARPSDAIGLAAGRDVPIYVSRRVLDEAGFDLEGDEGQLEEELDLDDTL